MKRKIFSIFVVFAAILIMASTTVNAQTYNNTRPGGRQLILGVDSVEIRPNLVSPGAQLWFHKDGRWDSQGGKFSLLFPTPADLNAWVATGRPSAQELKALAGKEPLCPDAVGKGQRWFPFKVK